MSCVHYDKIVDNLMYLMLCTRFDIAITMDKMSKYMSNISKMHLDAVKWIFKYFKNIKDYDLFIFGLLDNVKFLLG